MRMTRAKISAVFDRFFEKHGLKAFLFVVVSVITITVMWPSIFITIRSGEAGVLFKRITGTDTENVYSEGLHLIWPWDRMYVYNVRLQTVLEEFEVLTKNGALLNLKVAIRYKPDYRTLTTLHKLVGPDFLNQIVLPETEAILRHYIGQYEPAEIYTTKPGLIDKIVLNALENSEQRYVIIDDVLLKSVGLPESLRDSIDAKLVFEQKSLTYQYRLALEKEEAQRKRIEAEGIRDYNRLVSETLSEDLIRWQGVQATKELALSPNSKTVIIGGGQGGLPVILGGADASSPSTTSPAGAPELPAVPATTTPRAVK